MTNSKEFWLINKSTNRDVSLSDLRITIRKGNRINLLSKHYNFTIEQLSASAKSGSIYKKRHLLCVIEFKPQFLKTNMVIESVKPRILVPLRNPTIKINTPVFEELDTDDLFGMSDEQYALEQADAETIDHAPAILAVDKKYANSVDNEE